LTIDFRASFIKSKPAVLLLLFIGLTVFLGFFSWQFYSQVPEDTQTLIQQRTLTPHDELYAIHFPTEGRGWAVGKFGIILHTADGGKSWKQQNSGTTKPLTSVSFGDERHGFAVAGGGTILTTTDAGSSWQLRDSGTKDHLLEVHALSARSAFAVGGFGTVLSTNDGGATWTKHKLTWQKLIPDIIREIGDVEPNVNTVHFTNSKEGWLGGEFGVILHTRDSGHTWIRQRAGSNLAQIVALRFRDSSTGWAIGQKETLLKTADGGQKWQRISVEGQQDFYGISLNDKRGVIVGQGTILKTSDNGLDWVYVESSPQNIRFSGVAITDGTALAVGQSGRIHKVDLNESDGMPQATEKN
jgi:photosystem II stability/assembly factor-like uncharacterized protein